MVEISYEILTAILIIFFIAFLSVVYLWLYLLSKKNEEQIKQKKENQKRIKDMFSSIIYSPTQTAREQEVKALFEYIEDDFEKKDIAASRLIDIIKNESDIPESRRLALAEIYDSLDPIEFYANALENGSKYEKCYAMQKLADYSAEEKIDKIREYINSNNLDLVYSAAMACSEIGDEEGVMVFVKKCEDNFKYSHRVIIKCLQAYAGDREKLVRIIFDHSDNYIKAVALKSYATDKLEGLADKFIENFSSMDTNLKIAATKALAQLGNPNYEQKLIIALNDKNWIVRLAAVKGLEQIGGEATLEALVKATQDEEWWVRDASAKAIVNIDFDLIYVEKVLSGYDKYAADAVKSALYKQIKMNGGGFR